MDNIVLIGMPGSGKSTLGVLLAKALGYSFTDTDLIISRIAGKPLQRILDEDGLDSFLDIEEKVGAELECNSTVIATGGSMVLSEEAMKNLKAQGNVLYINVPLGEIKKLAEQKKLVFSQKILTYTMGNAITIEDTNGNRKLLKMRRDTKIDSVAALIDAYVAYKASEEAFD